VSQENVEIVRGAIEAWNRDDPSGFLDRYDSDIELHAHEGEHVLEVGVWRGASVVEEWFADYFRLFRRGLRMTSRGFTDLDDRVLALVYMQGAFRRTGIEFDRLGNVTVFTLREGKFVRIDMFGDESAALKAVGLE
jgi:ketosteroid isomerase-like protein